MKKSSVWCRSDDLAPSEWDAESIRVGAMSESCLYVVATPIGNLGDWSVRARETLQKCAKILCEDTRHSLPLLKHFGIQVPLVSLHEHNERQRLDEVLRWLRAGLTLGLICDAGTPAVSDPGVVLIDALRSAGVEVRPIAGACAAVAAFSICGWGGVEAEGYTFIGFLPTDNKNRQRVLDEMLCAPRATIFYESPHRLIATLNDLMNLLGADHPIFFAREISKIYEQSARTRLGELIALLKNATIPTLGEWVLILPPHPSREKLIAAKNLTQILIEQLGNHTPPSVLARTIAKITGEERQVLYQRIRDSTLHP